MYCEWVKELTLFVSLCQQRSLRKVTQPQAAPPLALAIFCYILSVR